MVRSSLQARHFPHSNVTSKSVTARVNKNSHILQLLHPLIAAVQTNPVNINVTDALTQCSVAVQKIFFSL